LNRTFGKLIDSDILLPFIQRQEFHMKSKSRAFFTRVILFSWCFVVSAVSLYARAGGSGGGRSSGGGSRSSGGGFSSGSSFGSSGFSPGGSHGSGSGAAGFAVFGLIFGGIIFLVAALVIYYTFFYKPSATGFKNFPDPEPKDFDSLDGADTFLAANPDFDEEQFLEKAKKAFMDIQTAWSAGDIQPVRRFLSDGVYQRFNTQFEMMRLLKQKNELSEITINDIFVDRIDTDGLFDILHVCVSAEMNDRFVCETNPDLNSPGGHESFTEYWSFMRKRGKGGKDIYFSQNCPNCSAPLPEKMGDAGNCPYCKSFVNSGEYDWVLSEITQVDDYMMNNYRHDKSLTIDKAAQKLIAEDENFSVQLVEDKASNAYLQIQTALAFLDLSRLRRFVSDDYFKKLSKEIPESSIVYNRLYLNDVSLIGVQEADGKNKLYIAVKSSYQRASLNFNKAEFIDPQILTKREVLVMERDKGAIVTKGSVYAHLCPACGAPVADSLNVKCTYCGSVMNSPKTEWIVSALLDASEYSVAAFEQKESFSAQESVDIEDSLYTGRDFAFNNALVIFGADGIFSDEEKAMAERLAKKWRYNPDYVAQMIQSAMAGRLSIRMPMDTAKCKKIFELMKKAATTDGTIAPEEQAILDRVQKEYIG
jgi:predicted lipid-binding transport protein (Tim44 family)/DNA-directed RNA polymerase subunit RPC12/RpoP